jgi:hypothetical protein
LEEVRERKQQKLKEEITASQHDQTLQASLLTYSMWSVHFISLLLLLLLTDREQVHSMVSAVAATSPSNRTAIFPRPFSPLPLHSS